MYIWADLFFHIFSIAHYNQSHDSADFMNEMANQSHRWNKSLV